RAVVGELFGGTVSHAGRLQPHGWRRGSSSPTRGGAPGGGWLPAGAQAVDEPLPGRDGARDRAPPAVDDGDQLPVPLDPAVGERSKPVRQRGAEGRRRRLLGLLRELGGEPVDDRRGRRGRGADTIGRSE